MEQSRTDLIRFLILGGMEGKSKELWVYCNICGASSTYILRGNAGGGGEGILYYDLGLGTMKRSPIFASSPSSLPGAACFGNCRLTFWV